ncbi:CHAT domain-containing protein [Nostoc sp. LEGE 06077]|nr:CHAT domain-containing protein [Nostoc sp. LEGE 06077]
MKKILMLSANPKDTSPLRLGEEVRKIQEALKLAKHQDQFEIATSWAVRVEDLRRALLDHKPHIVHFSGHGAGTEGLGFEDNSGITQLVSSNALASIFELFRGTVECVLLNACYSEIQAQAIHQHVDYVIGMNRPIGDVAAIEFAAGFYDALGAGESYNYAFSMGCASIQLKGSFEYSTPVLKSRPSSLSVFAKKTIKADAMSEKELQQKPNRGISFNISGGKIGSGIQAAQGNKNVQTMTNYTAAEEQPNIAETAKEIQKLLQQLEQANPTITTVEKMNVVAKAVDKIEKNTWFKARIIGAIKSAGTEAFKELIDHPLVNIFIASIEGWQQAE